MILLDYGFAKRQSTVYGNNSKVGTDGYMAPEVARKIEVKKITEKADIFSLGCILYYLLFGKVALTGKEKDLSKKIEELQLEVDQ